MKLNIKKGATSNILQVFVADSSSTTGAGLTGLAYNSGSLTAYYHRDTDTTATSISLANMTVGTFTSGGFKEIDATNMPGWYQFCPPDASLATGASNVGFHLKGATNMAPLPIEVQLVSYDPYDATRMGLSALPNANAGANTGLPVVGSQVPNANAGANGGLPTVDANLEVKASTLRTNNDKTGYTASTVSDKTGYSLATTPPTAVQIRTEMDSNSTKLANLDATVSSRSTYAGGAVASVTGNVGGNVVGSVASVTAGVTVTTNNDKTGYALTAGEHTGIVSDVNTALDAAGTELSSVPTTTGSLRQKLNYLFQYWRNKRTQTSSTETLYKEDASTPLGTSTVSDDGTTSTHGEVN